MPFSQLYIWVEGPDDRRFFETILGAELERKYTRVLVLSYASMKKEKITKFIESIRSPSMRSDYIFLADKDDSPCISDKKLAIIRAIKSLQPDRISVVAREIEGWYLAGLTLEGCKQLGIEEFDQTDHLSKEMFDRLRRADFQSRIDWMIEMLRYYSLQQAISRNSSLRYFVSKFLSPGAIED